MAFDTVKIVPLTVKKKKIIDPKTVAFYLQDIPLSDSLMLVSNELIKSALFTAGKIYRNDFNDFKRSTAILDELIRRFPGSLYELPAMFDLYQQYTENKDFQKADTYKNKIINSYPSSKYARYLINPGYFKEQADHQAIVEQKYEEALRLFQSYNFTGAAQAATTTLAMNPDTLLRPKIKFIETVSKGANQERTIFAGELDQFIKDNPKTSVTNIALKIKELIKSNTLTDYQKLIAQGYVKEEIINKEVIQNQSKEGTNGKYTGEEDMFHYFIIAFPKDAGVDVNRLIYDIANYNLDYYTSTDFDIEPINLDSKTQMVVIRSLPDKTEGMIYFRSIIRKRNVFQTLKGIGYVNFLASSSNYRIIIADKNYVDYLPFFTKNYSTYIGSNVPLEDLPNPEVLLSNARKKEETKEKGEYVVVQPSVLNDSISNQHQNLAAYNGPYLLKPGKEFNMVYLYPKAKRDALLLVKSFETFNSVNFGSPAIKVDNASLDNDFGMLIVSGLKERAAANIYYSKAKTDATLIKYLSLKDSKSFLISNENLQVLKKEKKAEAYLEFINLNK